MGSGWPEFVKKAITLGIGEKCDVFKYSSGHFYFIV